MFLNIETQDSPGHTLCVAASSSFNEFNVVSQKSCLIRHFGMADGAKNCNTHEPQYIAMEKEPVRGTNEIANSKLFVVAVVNNT